MPDSSTTPILTAQVRSEHDVVMARQRARQIAGLLGFDAHEQARIATATSEIARNAFIYAGGGRVEFFLREGAPQSYEIRVTDRGTGIADLRSVLDGRFRSPSGTGMGILGARRLMERFEIQSNPAAGTEVVLGQTLSRNAIPISPAAAARIVAELVKEGPRSAFEEVQHQNQELFRTLDELTERQRQVEQLNRELEETNRGVVALYAELDEKATQLRQASELKSRFLSYMSHEFRTPLNSIISLARLLLERADGDLSAEQEKQVYFVRKSADTLLGLVNDLLDLAKIEAGKVEIQPSEWNVDDLFSTLRGVSRPLLSSAAVELVFDPPRDVPPLYTDEGKVAQIVRNFISNALKFTETGEVRVRAEGTGDRVRFSVADTGIGIAAEDQERIFDEFSQIDSAVQKRVKGTGLGLPLSRRLAELLGGNVSVESRPGMGSSFAVEIPAVWPGARMDSVEAGSQGNEGSEPARVPSILIIDDDEVSRYLLIGLLEGIDCRISEAASGEDGLRLARESRPEAVFLDLMMPGLSGFQVLESLRSDPETRNLPVFILSSKVLNGDEVSRLEKTADAVLSKTHDSETANKIKAALARAGFNVDTRDQ